MMPMRRISHAIFSFAAALLTLMASLCAEDLAKFEITLEGPAVPDIAKAAKVEIRVFDCQIANVADAITNLAAEGIDTESLSFPMTVTISVPNARLFGIEYPCVGVLVSSGGNIIYWSDTRTGLNRRGATTVRLAPAE
jgi:hypothetical protein